MGLGSVAFKPRIVSLKKCKPLCLKFINCVTLKPFDGLYYLLLEMGIVMLVCIIVWGFKYELPQNVYRDLEGSCRPALSTWTQRARPSGLVFTTEPLKSQNSPGFCFNLRNSHCVCKRNLLQSTRRGSDWGIMLSLSPCWRQDTRSRKVAHRPQEETGG